MFIARVRESISSLDLWSDRSWYAKDLIIKTSSFLSRGTLSAIFIQFPNESISYDYIEINPLHWLTSNLQKKKESRCKKKKKSHLSQPLCGLAFQLSIIIDVTCSTAVIYSKWPRACLFDNPESVWKGVSSDRQKGVRNYISRYNPTTSECWFSFRKL